MDFQSKLDGHHERNQQLLKVFKEKQVDLEVTRSVELHFWARGQPNAVRLAMELYKRGFTLLLLRPEQNPANSGIWNIEAGTTASISHITSEGFVTMLTDVAAVFDADFDGWGTSD